MTGVLFLTGGFLGGFAGTATTPFFDARTGFAFAAAFFFFLGSSFLTRVSFFGAESELELVLDTRVLFNFFLTAGLLAKACELSESELLESLPDDDNDDELLSLLLLEVVSSELLTW